LSPLFTQHLLKTHKFNDEHLRKMVDTALTSLFYASNTKDIQYQVVSLLDSLVVHLTLLSLAHYNIQDEVKINNLVQSNSFSTPASMQQTKKLSNSNATIKNQLDNIAQQQLQQQQQHQFDLQQQNNFLDFMILVDSLFNVLCHDDTEYWPVAQRAVLIMIEISEIVSSGSSFDYNYKVNEENLTDADSIESIQNLRPNLANLALFDYLAEKICHLCYERSWNAKKAG
jgi:hypothetical protein